MNYEKPPTGLVTSGIEYAHEHAEHLIREVLEDELPAWEFNRDAIIDIVSYPSKGYGKNEFRINILVILDRNIDDLGQNKPFVAIRIGKNFRITKKGEVEKGFCDSSVMTHSQQPKEADLQEYFKTKGKNLYRTKI